MFTNLNSEKGSAFILALMVVAAVGLLVVPVVYLGTTGLRGTSAAEVSFTERYAVDAGVEEAMWHIRHDPTFAPKAGTTVYYTSYYNGRETSIEIIPAGIPTQMYTPTPIPNVSSGSASNLVPDLTVDPNFQEPCFDGCGLETFTYTLFLQNFGDSNEVIEGFGVCLPYVPNTAQGFQFTELVTEPYWTSYGESVLGGIQNLYWNISGEPFAVLDEEAMPDINDASTPYGECGSEDQPRQHVSWDFPAGQPGRLTLGPGDVASVTFQATATLGAEYWHFADVWVKPTNANGYSENNDISPVVVKFGGFDISSSAGGTTVVARTTVVSHPDTGDEVYIRSWQVE